MLTGTTSADGTVTVTTFAIAGVAGSFAAGATATIPSVGTLVINANGAFTFTPVANYNGSVPVVTYTMTDGSSGDTSTLTITIPPTDDAFTDANETVSVAEDTTLNGNVLTGTTSVDGAVTVTTFTIVGVAGTFNAGQTATIASVGTLVINANGDYTFTPVANYNGSVPVATYSMTDGSSGDTSTLSITVTPVNDNFTDANETVSVAEDTTLNGSVLTGTTSVDGPVTVTTFTIAGNATVFNAGQTATLAGVGTLTIAANGDYVFTPTANYNGPVPVATYTITDGSGTNDTSTLTITVTPANDPPVDGNETNTVTEDTTLTVANGATGDLLNNATDIDGGTLTVASYTVAGVAGTQAVGTGVLIAGVGTITINANGSYSFAPLANFTGTIPVITYTVSDGNGGADTSTLTLSMTAVNDPPSVGTSSASVTEEALAGGIPDTTGNPVDNASLASVSGTIAINDPDSTPTVTLTAPAAAISSGGVAVTWAGNGTAGTPLIGSAGGVEVIRATIDNGGAYTVTLSRPIDHVTGNNENITTLSIGVSATDGTATNTGAITLNIEDDAPTAVASTKAVALPAINTNIELILDVSGSMTTDNRLQVMKDSVSLMLDQYDNLGDVRVRIVTFSDSAAANSAGWISVAAAKTFVNGLAAGGATNYDAAIATAQTAWTTPGKMVNAQNVSYFLTDGAPTNGQAIQTADEAIWTDFLNRNDIQSFAYGIGTAAAPLAANIDPIAYNGLGAGTNTNATIVTDITQLPPILRDSVITPTGGDIVTGGLGAGSGMGADGGQLASLTVNGTTYAYNSASGGSITTTGTNRGVFDTTTNTMTITTVAGGKLVIDMDDGLYTYTPPGTTSTAFNEAIGFSLIDRDGDTASSTLTIAVSPPPAAPPTTIDNGLNLTLTTSTTSVATPGLHGEYYGYNETAVGGNNVGAGDTTVGNANTVSDLVTIINLRQGSAIVGTGTSASAAASDASWNATNFDYGVTPTVSANLGTNPTVAANAAITSGSLYNFLGAANAGNDNSALKATSTFGNTTDSMLRFAGSAYFAGGNYDFQVRADDGFSIRIDGVTVFEFNDIQSPTTRTNPTPIAISEGLHSIEILYWEQGGNAELQIGYKLSTAATFTSFGLDNVALFQSTALPTLSDLQDIVESSTNGQYLIRTGQESTGSSSNDTITGSAGRDRIHGDDGNDTISAGTGADWMEGGRGNDTLTGGAGSDTFRWQLSDRGMLGQPAIDTITDFNAAAAPSGGDVLDLRDLLQGEAGASNLQNYLDFSNAGGTTVLRISTTGGFTGGTYAAGAEDQRVVFQGVANLGTALGLAANATDAQIIQDLLTKGKLVTD